MARESRQINLKSSKKTKVKRKKNCKSLDLNESSRNTKGLILRNIVKIFCNSLETEYNYFKAFKKELEKTGIIDLKLEIIKTQNKGGKSPFEAVKYAISNTKTNEKSWVVFDKDDFILQETIDLARENNISLAWSNPCFELWFLNHFNYRTTALTTRECLDNFKKKSLKEFSIDYKKNNENYYKLLRNKIEIGIRNSKRNHQEFKKIKEKIDNSNPCTTVYILCEELKSKIKLIK